MLLYPKFIISCLQETLISYKGIMSSYSVIMFKGFKKLLIMSLATVVMLKRHVIMPTLTFILCNQYVVLSKRHVVLLIFTHAH